MNVVMIHEVTDKVLNVDLQQFDIITFDDGLYSQYKNVDYFTKYNKPIYFFISTHFVCPEDVTQNENVIHCSDAHDDARRTGNMSPYMKWSQIKELYNKELCHIGGHGHKHLHVNSHNLADNKKRLDNDLGMMISEFNKNNISINSFCKPYNDSSILYLPLNYNMFGDERIDIDKI